MAGDGFDLIWSGLHAFDAAIKKVEGQADLAARAIVTQSAAVVEAAAKGNFEGSHRKGEPHVGGNKPNVVTGTLRRSIRHDPVRRYGIGDYGTEVAPRTVYARRVELGGTAQGWRGRTFTTGKYPYFTPAVESSRPKLEAIAAEQWRRFLAL